MIKRFSFLFAFLISVFILDTSDGFAQRLEQIELEKIVITPSRIEEKELHYGGSVKVLEAKELEGKGWYSTKDALKEVGTLDLDQNGAFGGATSIFIRGANSNHTLFMLDGAKFYDPMSPNKAPDIAHCQP